MVVDGVRKKIQTHRIVIEAFVSKIPSGMQVNHINANPKDNRIENLEIVTPSQNIRHAFKLGYKGSNHGRFGYSHNASKPIYQIDSKTMAVLNDFGCAREANRVTGVSYKCISLCIRGKTKTAGGFIWKLQD